jgi:hypothetical protein
MRENLDRRWMETMAAMEQKRLGGRLVAGQPNDQHSID